MTDTTASPGERDLDWSRALFLKRELIRVWTNHNGYRDPYDTQQQPHRLAELHAIIERHGWKGTRVDPNLTWAATQAASWTPPTITEETTTA